MKSYVICYGYTKIPIIDTPYIDLNTAIFSLYTPSSSNLFQDWYFWCQWQKEINDLTNQEMYCIEKYALTAAHYAEGL